MKARRPLVCLQEENWEKREREEDSSLVPGAFLIACLPNFVRFLEITQPTLNSCKGEQTIVLFF